MRSHLLNLRIWYSSVTVRQVQLSRSHSVKFYSLNLYDFNYYFPYCRSSEHSPISVIIYQPCVSVSSLWQASFCLLSLLRLQSTCRLETNSWTRMISCSLANQPIRQAEFLDGEEPQRFDDRPRAFNDQGHLRPGQ